MYDILAFFFELSLGDPHLLELVNVREDGTSQPAAMLPVGRCEHLWTHWRWGQSLDFFLHSLLNSFEHSTSSSKDYILEQGLLNVNFALHD